MSQDNIRDDKLAFLLNLVKKKEMADFLDREPKDLDPGLKKAKEEFDKAVQEYRNSLDNIINELIVSLNQ